MKYKYGSIEVLKIHEDDIVVIRRKIEDESYEVTKITKIENGIFRVKERK